MLIDDDLAKLPDPRMQKFYFEQIRLAELIRLLLILMGFAIIAINYDLEFAQI